MVRNIKPFLKSQIHFYSTFSGKELPFTLGDSALVSTDKHGLFLISGCTTCYNKRNPGLTNKMLVLKNTSSDWKEIELPSKTSFTRIRHIAVAVNDNEKMVFCGNLHS